METINISGFEEAPKGFLLGASPPAPEPAPVRRRGLTEKERQRLEAVHRRLISFFDEELEKQAINRFQMAIDEDYADSLQWDDEEVQKLMDRNQGALVYNIIKPMILWLRGTEARTRTDAKVRPRTDSKEANEDAETKTEVMKYIADVNRNKFKVSQAFNETIVSGLSYLEDCATGNPEELPVYCGWESWKRILHDSCGKSMMGEDWRYMFRFMDVDEDIAKEMFPLDWQKREIDRALTKDGTRGEEEFWYLGRTSSSAVDWPGAKSMLSRRTYIDTSAIQRKNRPMLRLIEAWYRVPKTKFLMRGAIMDGQEFDHANDEHMNAYESGAVTLVNQTVMEMRVAMMTPGAALSDEKSPYKHNQFPFTPIWCYRRARDGAPYGIVRDMRDPQDSFNKHMSKAQWLLASNQIIADDDATQDWKGVRRQADKPNGTIRKKPGSEFKIERHQAEAVRHVDLAKLDLSMVRENYGTNTDSLGIESNARSGRAILARQEQGTVQSQPIFENLMMARQYAGEKRLSLAEQYITEERVIPRSKKARGREEFVTINKPYRDPSGQWRFENDITAFKARYVLDEQDWRASVRQAMGETMADMISKMPPEVGFKFLDMWVEFLDIPNREEYVRRIRQLNGMTGDSDDPLDAEINRVRQEAEQKVQQFQEQVAGEMENLKKTNMQLQGQVQSLNGQNAILRTKIENKSGELDVEKRGQDLDYEAKIAKIDADASDAKDKLRTEHAKIGAQREMALEKTADDHAAKDAAARAGAEKQGLQETIAKLQEMMAEERRQTQKAMGMLSEELKRLASMVKSPAKTANPSKK